MEPKQDRSSGKAGRSGPRPKISNYSLIGLATGVCTAFFLHNQLMANTLLGSINDIITVVLVNLGPALAVILSIMGIKDKAGRSDLSRMMGWVGLVFGLGTLMISILFSHSVMSDNSIFGIYDNLFNTYNGLF